MPPELQPSFKLGGFAITKSIFEVIPRPQVEDEQQRPMRLNTGIQINATIQMNPEALRAVVTLDVTVTPDLKWQPYRLGVTVVGAFDAVGVSVEQLDQFCRVGVPPILFPYVRETIHRLTMDAPHGPVRLDPINISAMLAVSAWTDVPQVATDSSAP